MAFTAVSILTEVRRPSSGPARGLRVGLHSRLTEVRRSSSGPTRGLRVRLSSAEINEARHSD